jgi:hypothetical protein
MIHQCPKCGSTDISYDYNACVTVNVVNGEIKYIVIGDPFGVNPDALFCCHCDKGYSKPTVEQGDALFEEIQKVIREPIDEITLYERKG